MFRTAKLTKTKPYMDTTLLPSVRLFYDDNINKVWTTLGNRKIVKMFLKNRCIDNL